jgi:L-amino acid N-acyltransferase YncA
VFGRHENYKQEIRMSREAVIEALVHYPINTVLGGEQYRIRVMSPADGEVLMAFARELPPHDILYMRRDITHQSGVDSWIKGLKDGVLYSLLAEDSHGVCGYSTINLNELEWTRHIADMRVTTAKRARGQGLGRLLAREAFNIAVALDVEKLIAHMTPDQESARVLFRELGFQPEALLRDHIKDRDGNYHDLLIKACSVQTFLALRSASDRD